MISDFSVVPYVDETKSELLKSKLINSSFFFSKMSIKGPIKSFADESAEESSEELNVENGDSNVEIEYLEFENEDRNVENEDSNVENEDSVEKAEIDSIRAKLLFETTKRRSLENVPKENSFKSNDIQVNLKSLFLLELVGHLSLSGRPHNCYLLSLYQSNRI